MTPGALLSTVEESVQIRLPGQVARFRQRRVAGELLVLSCHSMNSLSYGYRLSRRYVPAHSDLSRPLRFH